MIQKFRVLFLEEAAEFLDQVDQKAREKIIYNIRKSQIVSDDELFRKLNAEIWEFRTLYKKTKYRLFAFWDKSDNLDTVVVASHGLIKETDKTPQTDLRKAEELRREYLEIKKIEAYEGRKENENLLAGRNYR